ncbi:unnamed protein product, partial [Meganyctiphanes norvegica]
LEKLTPDGPTEQAVLYITRLKCDKSFMKEGEEVEVLDTSNQEYFLVRHRESKEEFYIKSDELDPSPITRSPKRPQVTDLKISSPISIRTSPSLKINSSTTKTTDLSSKKN